jgi:hypothetical protein
MKTARESLHQAGETALLPRLLGANVASSGTSAGAWLFDGKQGHNSMRLARVLLWAICALMCAVGILLFTHPSDLFDHVDQPRRLSETDSSASSFFQVAAPVAPAEVAAHQPKVGPSAPLRPDPDGESAEIASRAMAPPPVSLVQGAPLAAPANIASQQQDAPTALYLNRPPQNSPHAILPDAKPVIMPAETAARAAPATAEATELPSAVENPSPDALRLSW